MTDLENKAFAFIQTHTLYDECKGKHYRDKSDFELMAEFAQKQIGNLSQHIIDLQKDKGNLTDKVRELEQQIEKMRCCGNCKKLKCRFDSKTNINILYCSDSDMKQIEVGFQMCCCKWEIKEK